jgi:hypothetical protein
VQRAQTVSPLSSGRAMGHKRVLPNDCLDVKICVYDGHIRQRIIAIVEFGHSVSSISMPAACVSALEVASGRRSGSHDMIKLHRRAPIPASNASARFLSVSSYLSCPQRRHTRSRRLLLPAARPACPALRTPSRTSLHVQLEITPGVCASRPCAASKRTL